MGKPFINRVGHQYGKLTPLEFLRKPSGKSKSYWKCLCACGNITVVTTSNLSTGHTKSCGCSLIEELESRRIYKKEDASEYAIWRGIRQRTGARQGKNVAWYSGIAMCPEWRESFECFLADMGSRPTPHHSIERLDNTQGYCKTNCVWANAEVQANNRKTNRTLEFNGEALTLAEWGRRTGIKRATIAARIDRHGWCIEEALTTQIGGKL